MYWDRWIKGKCTRKWNYAELVQGDANCISGHPTNMVSFSGGQPSRFHKNQHQMHQIPNTPMQYNQFPLGQHLIHLHAYFEGTLVYFPHSYPYNWEWEYQYWWKIQYKLTLQFCKILYTHIFCLFYVMSRLMRKGSIMHHSNS